MEKFEIRQLSVFLEDKQGELTEVTSILMEENIDIKSLLLVDSTDFGILRLIVNDADKAKLVLNQKGYAVKENRLFAVKAEDKAGSFNNVVKVLCREEVDIVYTYAFSEKGTAVFLFKVGDGDFQKAIKSLQDNQIELIDQEFVL